MRGILITLEGIDGTGKSTVARMLAEELKGRDVLQTAEPTRGYAGRILRDQFLTEGAKADGRARLFGELFLFMADHADHLERTVSPALDLGKVVLSDRYADSTAAYQGATLRGLVPDPVVWIRGLLLPWNIVPDKTLLFTLEPEKALERIRARDQSLAKFEREEFLGQVAENFKRLACLEPDRFAMIDASQETCQVAEDALKIVLDLLRHH
ncbi:MAG TPA: dTMP kinase [Methanotrichaceae archaeon]|nr:dTMP kinase [Methanotrichaceae archaeon]